jgi:magnesium transporter
VLFGETHIFVGRGFVVTVRHGPSSSYAPVRKRCEANKKGLSNGEDFILHALLDFIVDNYMPVIDEIERRVELLEERVFSNADSDRLAQELYRFRRQLVRLRNVVVPLLDVCRALQEPGLPGIDQKMRPLFRDIADHLRRLQEQIESAREILTFAFEASVVAGQASQTAITRKLAAWAAVLAVPTAIAGIYGMNFEHMPELRWRYGYPLVIAVIVVLCTGLIVYFRRKRWL